MIYVDDLIAAILYLLHDSAQNSAIFELDDGHAGGYSWNENPIGTDDAGSLGFNILAPGVITLGRIGVNFPADRAAESAHLVGTTPGEIV